MTTLEHEMMKGGDIVRDQGFTATSKFLCFGESEHLRG